ELTKIYEEVFRGKISQAREHFAEPRGEFTLVIEGRSEMARPLVTGDIRRRLHGMRSSGVKAKEAIARVAGETGLSRKELYRVWLES
ncbi:MAG TPA: 16S rRNA (cytidine(1402)-2'-O)-methyltransferase, partial [Dehalococcoidia bacterium]|nr:16S rRNA (cytidine(1402)-2'-O)-methyltransferase [Dehalococcoidia bacterium]